MLRELVRGLAPGGAVHIQLAGSLCLIVSQIVCTEGQRTVLPANGDADVFTPGLTGDSNYMCVCAVTSLNV